jgi:hypothetical protein
MVEIWPASRRADVVEAMRSFYAETDCLIAAHEPVCRNCGRCCRFGEFGPRLYVTALEVAYYLAGGPLGRSIADDACPHAYDGACHARDRRFLLCRVFFCDPASQVWQGPLIEQRLACLRRLHDELHVPYFYADWTRVLTALEGKSAFDCLMSGFCGSPKSPMQGPGREDRYPLELLEVQQVLVPGDQAVGLGGQERPEDRHVAGISAGVDSNPHGLDDFRVVAQELHGSQHYIGRQGELLRGLMSELAQDVL